MLKCGIVILVFVFVCLFCFACLFVFEKLQETLSFIVIKFLQDPKQAMAYVH